MVETMGQKINRLRKQKNMTQDELAELMNVSSQAVSKWEKDMSIPDLSILIELADFFHVSLDELVREKEQPVHFIPDMTQQTIQSMFLRVFVHSSEGDIVKVNLPLAFVKMAAEMSIEIPQIKGNDLLKEIDLSMIVTLIESGIVGKLVEVQTSQGDVVEIVVG